MGIIRKAQDHWWILLAAALICVGGPILFYASGERDRQIKELTEEAVENEALYIVGNLNDRLVSIINDLIAMYGGTPPLSRREHLEQTAHLIEANPFLLTINYIGTDRRIKFVSPLEPNRKVIGQKIEIAAPKEAMEMALSSHRPYLSRPFGLIQGEPGYSLMIPSCADNGIFEVVFRVESIFEKGSPLRHRKDIAIQVSDGTLSVFHSREYGNQLPTSKKYMAETEARLLNRTIVLNALPTDSLRSKALYYLRSVVGGGVIIFFILLITIVLLQAFNIRERKKTAAELKRQREEGQTILDSVPASIFFKNRENRILRVNKVFAEVLGLPKEEIEGKTVFNIYPDVAEKTWEEDQEVIFSRQSKENIIHQVQTHKGMRWINTHKIPYEDQEGNIIGIIGFSLDITEQKNLETLLQHAQKMEAIGALAGGIAHDFNNILGAIIGYTELTILAIRGAKDPSVVRHDLEQVLSASNRAGELVKQILTFSRQSETEMRPLEIDIVVKEALRFLRSSIPATIEIRQGIRPGTGMVMADPTRIHQVIMNLCANAVQAMGGKGVLKVKLSREDLDREAAERLYGLKPGPYQKLTVTDTGCGMDREVMEKIYDPYFTTKGVGKGTGLGLAVVYGIVKECGGAISVESKLGKGSTFNVFFPETVEEGVNAQEKESTTLPTGEERILLVDDEKSLVDLWKIVLGGLGYQVTGRTSGIEAMGAFQLQPDLFDLVITDLTMAGLTGMELATSIMKIRPGLPVILCTGFSDLITQEEVKEAGIREVLLKPLTGPVLARAVRRALGG